MKALWITASALTMLCLTLSWQSFLYDRQSASIKQDVINETNDVPLLALYEGNHRFSLDASPQADSERIHFMSDLSASAGNEAKHFVDTVFPEIVKGWNSDTLWNQSSVDFRKQVPQDQLKAKFKQYQEKFGSFMWVGKFNTRG